MVADDAHYKCSDQPGCSQLNITISRMLIGQEPFYMKFGFEPSINALNKINRNLNKMANISTNEYPLLVKIEEWCDELNISAPESIIDIIKSNRDNLLAETLDLIMKHDCEFYSEIYVNIFKNLKLEKLKDTENNYTLFMNETNWSNDTSQQDNDYASDFKLILENE